MRLTSPERRWAQAVFEAIFPSGVDPRLPIGAHEVDMVGNLERILALTPLPAAWGARMAFLLLEGLPPLVLGELALFSRLDPRRREECLRRLVEHPVYVLREMFALVKSMALIAYFDDPRPMETIRRAT